MAAQNLFQLLGNACSESAGINIYGPRSTKQCTRTSYRSVLERANHDALKLHDLPGMTPDTVVLLHFDQHADNIRWFWGAAVAGYVPCISPPLTKDPAQRKRHFNHLQNLLNDPIILTTEALVDEFAGVDNLRIHAIESLSKPCDNLNSTSASGSNKKPDDLATLMLTSGSTGNAKAVCLRHGQLMHALKGKSAHFETTSKDIFLNWIGLDHVADLTEVHLHAMFLGADQYHVQASDLIVDPLIYTRLMDKHRITYTFSPNFFLASVVKALKKETVLQVDLSCLRNLVSGGEANTVETCAALTELLHARGAPANFLRPGFGMTETCAGSIYGKACPAYELKQGLEYASLGLPTPAISMRIASDDGVKSRGTGQGELQVKGPSVFSNYYNNPQATKDAFTEDGWFKTGDTASIDSEGCLNMAGRAKDTIIVNGVKYSPTDIETAVEEAGIPGVTPSQTAIFAFRPKGSDTESYCVVYLPEGESDGQTQTRVSDTIAKTCINTCNVRPFEIVPVEKVDLPKTSLGKISRAKVRAAYENGQFSKSQRANAQAIKKYRASQRKPATTDMQKSIVGTFLSLFDCDPDAIGIQTSLFDLGVDSIALVRFNTRLQADLKLDQSIPLSVALLNPTIEAMAVAIEELKTPQPYDPVVKLQLKGDKTPLWLVHPGVGEILVFLNLAKYFTDRPIYALRARGFNAGETVFESLEEVIGLYSHRIKEVQPEGPYAIAGYSYGGMIAFETSKALQAQGERIAFFGSFNLPPHIKFRMRQLDYVEVVVHIAYFLDLITEQHAVKVSPMLHEYEGEQAIEYVMQVAPPGRLAELGLDHAKLRQWADVSHALHRLAVDYDPSGEVPGVDIFIAIPLARLQLTKQQWRDEKLAEWNDFTTSEARFHDVDGEHYTMMGEEHVHAFQRKLKAALVVRGI